MTDTTDIRKEVERQRGGDMGYDTVELRSDAVLAVLDTVDALQVEVAALRKFNDKWQEDANKAWAEVTRLRSALEKMAALVERVAEQQAMRDDSWMATRDALLAQARGTP